MLNHVKKNLIEQLQEYLSANGVLLTLEDLEITDRDNDIIINVNNIQISKTN